MPYDEEGNFVYPLPTRRGKVAPSKPPSRPVRISVVPPQPSVETLSSPALSPSPDLPPLTVVSPSPVPEPQPSTPPLVLPMADNAALFTVQEGSNRWQMSELDLAQLWNAQLWPPGLRLTTSQGQPVEVVYRGRWSGGFGPDFKGAIVRIGTELHRGDVELHLRSGDWHLHGHHTDTRYNNVVLQVTIEDNLPQSQAGAGRTQHGVDLPVLALLPLYQKVGYSLLTSLEGARASGTRLGSLSESEGQCCDRVAERTTDLASLMARIDELGDKRFEERANRFEAACATDPDSSTAGAAQELWAGLLEALGYSQNKAPFRRLAGALPLASLVELDYEARRRKESGEERLLNLEAALLGAAGLLPTQRRLRTKAHRVAEPLTNYEPEGPLEDYVAERYIGELEGRWAWLERHLAATVAEWQPLRESDWTFARLRPPNHPSRRIAGLARWLLRWKLEETGDLLENLTRLLALPPAEACKELSEFGRVEFNEEESDSAAFWARRYDFSDRAILADQQARGARADLIGSDRAADIVVNILLPFLAGYGRDRRLSHLTKGALAVYRVHPRLGSNELVENVAKQVFQYWLANPAEAQSYFLKEGKGELKGGKLSLNRLIDGARRQQGLIYLHHNFCADQHFAVCPLA